MYDGAQFTFRKTSEVFNVQQHMNELYGDNVRLKKKKASSLPKKRNSHVRIDSTSKVSKMGVFTKSNQNGGVPGTVKMEH